MEPLHQLRAVLQARLAEVLVELVALLEEQLQVVRADEEDVVLLDRHALLLRRGEEVVVVEGATGLDRLDAEVAGHVDEDAAAGDAALRDRLDARLVQAAHRGARVIPVPDLTAVPDVAQRVVLRGALEERDQLVIRVVEATGEVGGVVAVPRGLVDDHLALRREARRPDRVALGISDESLEGVELSGLDGAHAAQHLVVREEVERPHLVIVAPAAPVLRSIGQEVCEVWCFCHGSRLSEG